MKGVVNMTNKQRKKIEGLLNDWVQEVLDGLLDGFGSREADIIVDEIEEILEEEKEEVNIKPIAF